MSKFINFKIKWPKSVGKHENGGRVGPLRQNLPPKKTNKKKKTDRWIRQCLQQAEAGDLYEHTYTCCPGSF